MQRLILPTILTALLLGSPAAFAAEAEKGAALARLWCASCHVIAREQRQASADATPFHEIAARPNFDED